MRGLWIGRALCSDLVLLLEGIGDHSRAVFPNVGPAGVSDRSFEIVGVVDGWSNILRMRDVVFRDDLSHHCLQGFLSGR